jgi:hypothetical protein
MKKSNVKLKNKAVFLILFLFCISQAFAAPCGDVNSNGVIDIVDALMTAQYYVGLNPQNYDAAAADVNGDGGITIVDALVTAQYYVKLISGLPGCDQPTPPPTTPPPTATPLTNIQKPRIIATTDGEGDDKDSMVRFLLYSCDFDVVGIVENNSIFQGSGHSREQ